MAGQHFFNFNKLNPQKKYSGGSRISLTNSDLPLLNRISMAILKIAPQCSREPHWHPNAGELGYCVNGKAVMTVFSPGNAHDTFTVSPGELFFVPMGSIHDIVNIGDEEVQILLAYSNQNPEDLDLSQSFNSMSDRVLASTFSTNEKFINGLKNNKDVFITSKCSMKKPILANITSRFKVNIEGINPQIISKGGSAKIANSYTLPTLENIAMFSLRLYVKGVREPHWHPNANELNYVIKGKAYLRILSPDGSVDEKEIGPGEGSYIPASYFHHIENAGNDELQMAVFFSNAIPNDIGISGAFSAYSNEELASVFGVSPDYFKDFNRIQQDVMIVAGGG